MADRRACAHLRQWLPFRWRPGESYLLPCADTRCEAGIDGNQVSLLDVEPHKPGKFPKAFRTVLVRREANNPRRSIWRFLRVEEVGGQQQAGRRG